MISKTFLKNTLFVALSSFFFSCAYFNTYYNTKKYFREAVEENKKRTTDRPTAAERRKFDQTISQASKVLQLYPDSKYVDDALLIIGKSFYHIEEYRKSERKFKELIELFPNSELFDFAELWLAKAQVQLQKHNIALTNFQAILQKTKKKEIRNEAQFWLGETFLLQENYIEASKEFNKALEQISDNELKIKTYQRLGDCYLKLSSNHQAAESFRQAAKRSKNTDKQFDLNLQYSRALIAAQKPDEAVNLMNKLIAVNDQHKQVSLAKLELANAYLAMKADKKALELYNEIIEVYPRTTAAAGAYLALAQYDEKVLHNYETAEKNYKQVRLQDAKSKYAKIANRSATNIGQLTKLQKEIGKLNKLLQKPDENNEQIAKKLLRSEFDDDFEAIRTNKQKTTRNRKLPGAKERQKKKPSALNDNQLAEEFKDIRKSKLNTKNVTAPQKPSTLSQTQIDSVKLLITQKKLEMAELFLFRLELPDSALFYYIDAISGSNSNEHRALAFYSIAEIYDDIHNLTAVRDSVLKILANNYINTPQGIAATQLLGMQPVLIRQNPLALAFENAQHLYLQQNRPKAAVKKLQDILAGSPNRDLKIQTIYTIGWICEKKLHDNKQAITYYSQLLKEYPDTEYAKKVKKKIKYVEQEKLKKEKQDASPAARMQATNVKTGGQKVQDKPGISLKNTATPSKNAAVADSTKSVVPADSLRQSRKK